MATTTSSYALQRVKGIKRSFDNSFRNYIDKYLGVGHIHMVSTSEVSEIFNSTESMSGVKELAQLEVPPTMVLEDGYQVIINEKQFGGAIILPHKVYAREGKDKTWKVDEYLQRQRNLLLKKNKLKMCTNAHLMLNEAFDSTSDYLAPDGVELCGTHSWNSGGTFDNGVTAALDTTALDAADAYAGAHTDASGAEDPLSWTHIVVKKGSAAHREAIRQYAKEIVPTAINDIKIYDGMVTIIATPYITSANANYWFLMDLDYDVSPLYLGVGMYPSLESPIILENQAIRTNCLGYWKQGVNNMPYQIYGSDGTT